MINEFEILDVIKVILDDDTILASATYLNVKPADSKVFIGIDPPKLAGNPRAQVYVMTHEINESKVNSLIVGVSIYADAQPNDLASEEKISLIANRVNVLLDETILTVVDGRIFGCSLETVLPITENLRSEPTGRLEHFRSLRYRLFAVKH
jgi:hypothetical protein